MAAGALLLFLVIRYSLRSDESVAPYLRTFFDLEIEWKCEAGHTFRAAGQFEPRKCWSCNALAYSVRKAVCPVHGETDVWVKFETGVGGAPRPSGYRTAGGEWTGADGVPLCPKCKREMAPVREDPLAKLKTRKARPAEPDGPRREPPAPAEKP